MPFGLSPNPEQWGWVRAPTGGHDTNWGGLPNRDGFGQQMGKPVAPWDGRTTGILPFAAQQRPELVSGLTDRASGAGFAQGDADEDFGGLLGGDLLPPGEDDPQPPIR